jgi:hypothetical protein
MRLRALVKDVSFLLQLKIHQVLQDVSLESVHFVSICIINAGGGAPPCRRRPLWCPDREVVVVDRPWRNSEKLGAQVCVSYSRLYVGAGTIIKDSVEGK